MSYTKNTWANGDTITATKLNSMETGIYNADTAAASAASTASSAAAKVPLVISAEATLNGSVFTPTNIDATPTIVAAAVTAKIPICLRLTLTVPDEGEDLLVVQMVPFTQVIMDTYNFVSIADADGTDGATCVKAELTVDGAGWEASGKIVMLPAAGA